MREYPNRRFISTIQNMRGANVSISLNKDVANWRGSKCYVENAAQGITIVAEHSKNSGEIYNLAEEHLLTELEWAQKLAELMDWRGEIRLTSNHDIAMNELNVNPFQHLVADTAKIRNRLGYREAWS
jgi:nucleoside-diphosphate-sugar epimerase